MCIWQETTEEEEKKNQERYHLKGKIHFTKWIRNYLGAVNSFTNIHLEPWYSNRLISLVLVNLERVHMVVCVIIPGCYFSTCSLAWSWSWEGGVLNEVSKLFYPDCKCHRKMEKTDLLLARGLKLRLTDETDCSLIHWLMVFSLGLAKKHEWRTWPVMLESSNFIWYSMLTLCSLMKRGFLKKSY